MARSAVVETPAGALRGRSATAGDSFAGIPYAQARRFAAPEPVPAWSEVREATVAGPVAPQPRRPLGEFSHGPLPPGSESCLNLNVWMPPPGAAGLRPVLVWIHGGGFVLGAGSAGIHDGARLAATAGIVVVTLNYRLGSLGWLYHPDLADAPGAPAGNWGLLDQIAALEWVRDSIEAFGGDPSRVTVAGQSAGALCALDLLVVPRANGLFQRAILQSPPFGDVAGDPAFARGWAEALGRAGGAVEGFDVDALRRLAAVDIVGLHEALLTDPGVPGHPRRRAPDARSGQPAGVSCASPRREHRRGRADRIEADEATFFFRAAGRRLEPDDATLTAMVSHFPDVDDAGALIDTYRQPPRQRRRQRAAGPRRHRRHDRASVCTLGVRPRRGRRQGAPLPRRPRGRSRPRSNPHGRRATRLRNLRRWRRRDPARGRGWRERRGVVGDDRVVGAFRA